MTESNDELRARILSNIEGTNHRARLVQQLGGGSQGDTVEINFDNGPAVLKYQPPGPKAERIWSAAKFVNQAYELGVSTARWLFVNRLGDGTVYYVQAFVDGKPFEPSELDLSRVCHMNDGQAGIARLLKGNADMFDRSDDIIRRLTEAPSPFEGLANSARWSDPLSFTYAIEAEADGNHLFEKLRQIGQRGVTEVFSSRGDVVLGDLVPSNILIEQGRAVGIDVETIGRGPRVFDLAELYRALMFERGPARPIAELAHRAQREHGTKLFASCLAASLHEYFEWLVKADPQAAIDRIPEAVLMLAPFGLDRSI